MVALGILLSGCADKDRFATFLGGACEAFPRPDVQPLGQTINDQLWIDKTVETGVVGCGWQRPAERPPALAAAPPPKPLRPVKKKRRFRDLILKSK